MHITIFPLCTVSIIIIVIYRNKDFDLFAPSAIKKNLTPKWSLKMYLLFDLKIDLS